MPGLSDESFARSVVYVCEHSERGAMGIVINKPADISLVDLFGKVDLPLGREDLREAAVFLGGPLHTDRGFVLHSPVRALEDAVAPSPEDSDAPVYASTLTVPGGLEVTTSRDVLEAMANGAGPQRVLVSLGYASWGEGQLESELGENSWLTVAADTAVIFDTPISERYAKALSLLGVSELALSAVGGRA
jgi:putative transcriptional regulator